jgi:hypothetical protein
VSLQGHDANQLVNKMARVTSKREGLAGELDGAKGTLADQEREQDCLAAEGLSLRNNLTEMANRLTSVGAERDNVLRELRGEQDCLWNNTTELADKLARIVGSLGWGAELDGARATLLDCKREQDGLVAIIVE